MAEAARPSAGVVGRSLKAITAHPRTLVGGAAVLSLPVAATSFIAALHPSLSAVAMDQAAALLVGVLVTYAATLAVRCVEQGEDPGAGGLLRMVLSRGLVSFTAVRLLVGMILALGMALGVLPFLVALARHPEVLTSARPPEAAVVQVGGALLLSAPVAIAVLLWLYLQIGLAGAANVFDRLPPTRSLSRSRQLTRGRKAEFFAVVIAVIALRFVLSLVLGGPASVVGGGSDTFEAEQSPTNPFFLGRLVEGLSQPEALAVPAAVVVGISSYLGTVAVLLVGAVVLAHFFLALRGPLEPQTPEEVPGEPPAPSPEA
ncbi:MAG: hypothetical protein ACT4OM_07300 [Actinomycetota bacterium]